MAGEDVLSLIQQFTPVNTGNVATLGKNKDATEQASQEALAAKQKANELSGIIEKQKNDAALQTQIETQTYEALAGGKITNPNSLMARLVQDRAAQEDARMAQAKKIEQMDSVGFLDNPVQYIMNAFSINGEIDKHNFHAQQADADSTAITAIQNGTQEANKTALVTANNLTKATQAAQTEMAAQLLQEATAKLKIQLAGENTQAIQALMAGQQQAVQTAYTGLRVKLDLAQEGRAQADELRKDNAAKMAEESFLLHAQETNLRIDAMQQTLQDKKDDKEMQQKYVDIIKTGAAKLRLNPDDFSLQSIKLMEKIPAQKPLLDALTRNGLLAATSPVGAGPIADTPAESLFTIDTAGSGRNFQNTPEAGTYNRLLAAQKEALTGVTLTGTVAEQNAKKIELIDAKVTEKVAVYKNDAEARDSFYAAPKLQSLVKNDPGLEKTVLYATVLKPMIDAGITDITAASVKAQIKEAVSRGILPQGLAMAEGARLFSSVATYNNVHGRLYDFGIPTQKGYVIPGYVDPWTNWGIAGKQVRFNLMNPTDFAKWYLYDTIAEVMDASYNSPPLFNKGATEEGVKP